VSHSVSMFRVIALAIGIAIVCAVEALLHLAAGLAPAPLLMEADNEQAQERQLRQDLNPQFPQRFFAGSAGERFMDRLEMVSQPHLKQPLQPSFRVVLVGGSSAQGYPHPRHATAAAHLQTLLQEAWPRTHVEVLNTGIVAIASFAVARTLEEAMALRPDAVVIYCGHNEFYGVYGAASVRQGGTSIELKRLHYSLMQMRTAALARLVVGYLRPAGERAALQSSASLLEVMAAAGSIAPDDSRRELARQSLHQNLSEMVGLCRKAKVPVVLCTLVSNDTDFEPDHSTQFVDFASPDQRNAWDDLIARAHSSLSQSGSDDKEKAAEALGHLDQAATLFDDYALLHFLRGRALTILNEGERARVAFVRARDLDTTPWRAPSLFNETIRQVATLESAILADVEASFARQSPPSGVGKSLMYDHLHPSRSGQRILAQAIARPLLERQSHD
jgi:hypothetical protein